MSNHNNVNTELDLQAITQKRRENNSLLPTRSDLNYLQTIEILGAKYLGHGQEVADYAGATISSWEVYSKTLRITGYDWLKAEHESKTTLYQRVKEIREKYKGSSVLGEDRELINKSDLSLFSLSAGLLPETISTPIVMLLNLTGVEVCRRAVNLSSAKDLSFQEYLDLEDKDPSYRALRAARNLLLLSTLSLFGGGWKLTFAISSSGVLGEKLISLQQENTGTKRIYDIKSLVTELITGQVPEEILNSMVSSKSFCVFSALTMGRRVAGVYDSFLDSPNDLLQAVSRTESVGYNKFNEDKLYTSLRAIGQSCLIVGALVDLFDLGTSQSKVDKFGLAELRKLGKQSEEFFQTNSLSELPKPVQSTKYSAAQRLEIALKIPRLRVLELNCLQDRNSYANFAYSKVELNGVQGYLRLTSNGRAILVANAESNPDFKIRGVNTSVDLITEISKVLHGEYLKNVIGIKDPIKIRAAINRDLPEQQIGFADYQGRIITRHDDYAKMAHEDEHVRQLVGSKKEIILPTSHLDSRRAETAAKLREWKYREKSKTGINPSTDQIQLAKIEIEKNLRIKFPTYNQNKQYIIAASIYKQEDDTELKKIFRESIIKEDSFGLKIAEFVEHEYFPRYEALLRELGVDLIIVKISHNLQAKYLTQEEGYHLKPDKIYWTIPVVSFEEYLSRPKAEGGFDSKDRNTLKRNLRKSEKLKVKFEPLTEDKYQSFYQTYLRMVGAMPRGKNNLAPDWFKNKKNKNKYLILSLTDPETGRRVASSTIRLDIANLSMMLAYAAIEPDCYHYDPSTKMLAETLKEAKRQGYTQISYGRDYNLFGYFLPLGLMGFKSFMGFRPSSNKDMVFMKILSPEKFDSQSGFFTFSETDGSVCFNHFGDNNITVTIPNGATSRVLPTAVTLPHKKAATASDILSVLLSRNFENSDFDKIEKLLLQCVGKHDSNSPDEIKKKLSWDDNENRLALLLLIPYLSDFGYLNIEMFYELAKRQNLLTEGELRESLSSEELDQLINPERTSRLSSYIEGIEAPEYLMQALLHKVASDLFSNLTFYQYCISDRKLAITFRSLCQAIIKTHGTEALGKFLNQLHLLFDFRAFLKNPLLHNEVKLIEAAQGLTLLDIEFNPYHNQEDNGFTFEQARQIILQLKKCLINCPEIISLKKPIHFTDSIEGKIISWLQQLIDNPQIALSKIILDCNFSLEVENQGFTKSVELFLGLARQEINQEATNEIEKKKITLAKALAEKIFSQKYFFHYLVCSGIDSNCLNYSGRRYSDVFLEILSRASRDEIIMLVNSTYDQTDLFSREIIRQQLAANLELVEEIFAEEPVIKDPLIKYPFEATKIFRAIKDAPSILTFLNEEEQEIWIKELALFLGLELDQREIKEISSEEELLVMAIRKGNYKIPTLDDYKTIFVRCAMGSGNVSPLIYLCTLNQQLTIEQEQIGGIIEILNKSRRLFWFDLIFLARQINIPEFKVAVKAILSREYSLQFTSMDMRDEYSGNRNLETSILNAGLSTEAAELLVASLLSKIDDSRFVLALAFSSYLNLDVGNISKQIENAFKDFPHKYFISLREIIKYLKKDSPLFLAIESYYFRALELWYDSLSPDAKDIDTSFILMHIQDPITCAVLNWSPELSTKPTKALALFIQAKIVGAGNLSHITICNYARWLMGFDNAANNEDYLHHALILLTGFVRETQNTDEYNTTITSLGDRVKRISFINAKYYYALIKILEQLDPLAQANLQARIFNNSSFIQEHPWREYGYSEKLAQQVRGFSSQPEFSERDAEILVDFLFSCSSIRDHQQFANAILMSVPTSSFANLVQFLRLWRSLPNDVKSEYAANRVKESLQKIALKLSTQVKHSHDALAAEIKRREVAGIEVPNTMRDSLRKYDKYIILFGNLTDYKLKGWEQMFLFNLYAEIARDYELEFNPEEEVKKFCDKCSENIINLFEGAEQEVIAKFILENISELSKSGILEQLTLYSCFANESGQQAIREIIRRLADINDGVIKLTWKPDKKDRQGITFALAGDYNELYKILETKGLTPEQLKLFFTGWQETWYHQENKDGLFTVTSDLERWLKHAREPVSTCQALDGLRTYPAGNWNLQFGPDNSDGRPLARALQPQFKLAELRKNEKLVVRALVEVTLDLSDPNDPKLALLVEQFHILKNYNLSEEEFYQYVFQYGAILGISPENVYFANELTYNINSEEDPNLGKYPAPLPAKLKIYRDTFRTKKE